jgi:hypothetical protein
MVERNNYFPSNSTNNPGAVAKEETPSNRPFARYNGPQDNGGQRPMTEPLSPRPTPPNPAVQTAPLSPPKNGTGREPEGKEVMRGVLGAFSPSSLLSLLNIQKSSGRLWLRSGKAEGFIYVDRGEVYDSGLGSVNGALALFQLFGWRQGEFSFEIDGPVPSRRTIEASLPVLQVRATLWLDNMNKYMPIIPSTSHRIAVANEPRSEVVIEPYQWPVLTKIVSKPLSIAQLAAELDQDLMTVTRIAADLVKMGVAVVHDPETPE